MLWFRIIFLMMLSAAAAAADTLWLSGSASATMAAAMHYRRQVNQLFPSEREKRISCSFSVPPPDGTGKFGFRRIRPDVYEITFPPQTSEWLSDPVSRTRLVKWLVCVQLGFPLERAVLFPDSWLFAALAMPADNMFSPRQVRYPGAYAMVSHGIHFSPERILRYPVPASRSASFELYSEWSRILFELCHRGGVLKHGAGEAFFRRLASKPETDQYLLFSEIFVPSISAIHSGAAVNLNEWFSVSAEQRMLSAFSPAAGEYIESRAHAILGTGKKEDIVLLFEKKKMLTPEEKLRISKTILDLTRLSMLASEDLAQLIRELTFPLEFLKNAGYSKKNQQDFQKSFKDFLQAAALESLRCEMLRQAENRLVMPGARHFMINASAPGTVSVPILNAADTMLDRFERSLP